MLFILNSLGKLFGIPEPSKRTTMNQDPLLNLVDSSLSLETHTFLRRIIHLALLSPNPKLILNRFMVQRVTHYTDCPTGTQNEIILLELIDTHRSGSRPPLYIRVERTASVNQPSPPPSYFTDHPDSATVLKSIVEALKATPANSSTSVSRSNTTPPSTCEMIGESELLTPSSKLQFLDPASLRAMEAIDAPKCSISQVYKADDRFTGGRNLELHAHAARNVHQIFPHSLSLFEFAVLADTVHNHDPLFSTLKSGCYWFVRVICNVLTKEYSCSVIPGKHDPLVSDDISIPPNDHYLPNLAGRCVGILISTGRVEEAVTTVIQSNFRKYRQEKREEVCFIVYPERYLLKHRYRYETDGRSII
jgi:hypothetical protein